MLSKVIFTAAVATSVQAGILDNIGSLHQTSPGIGTLQHTKPALGSIQHTKPALGSKPNKPTRERVNHVSETVKKIGQIAGSDSITAEQKKKALGALQQVGIIVGLDKELNKLHDLKDLGHSVDEIVDKYETICKASGIAQTIPMINLPNVTELMLDAIYAKSEHAEPIVEKVMTALGASVEDCEENDCLNPCHDKLGSCLKCFNGALHDKKRLPICDQCVM